MIRDEEIRSDMEIGDKRFMASDSCSIPPQSERKMVLHLIYFCLGSNQTFRETIQISESETAERSFGFMYCF